MTSPDGGSPRFEFESNGRPHVKSYVTISKFRTGDKVYLTKPGSSEREGPYVIASVPSAQRYTLSLENGQAINDGDEIEEDKLTVA